MFCLGVFLIDFIAIINNISVLYSKECEKFQMKVELADTWDQAENLMAEYVNLWTPLKEYNEGEFFILPSMIPGTLEIVANCTYK